MTRDLDKQPYSPDEARVAQFFSRLSVDGGDDPIGALIASHAGLAAQCDEMEQLFDLQHKADRRAVVRWRAANPGKDMVFPDRADLVVWLMGQLESKP